MYTIKFVTPEEEIEIGQSEEVFGGGQLINEYMINNLTNAEDNVVLDVVERDNGFLINYYINDVLEEDCLFIVEKT